MVALVQQILTVLSCAGTGPDGTRYLQPAGSLDHNPANNTFHAGQMQMGRCMPKALPQFAAIATCSVRSLW